MTVSTSSRRPLTRDAEPSLDVVGAGGRRAPALLVDVIVVLAPLLAVPLLAPTRVPAGWAWALAAAGVAAVSAGLLRDLGRTGRTPGRRLLGIRTVSPASGLPPTPIEVFGHRLVDADLRAGRDPLLLVPRWSQPSAPARRDRWHQARAATGSWRLALDDGGEIEVARSTLLGRAPSNEDGEDHALVSIPDLSRSIARVHALVEPDDDCLWLTDAGGTNGTRATWPSASGATMIERRLWPRERVAVRAGGTIHLGDRVLQVTRSTRAGG